MEVVSSGCKSAEYVPTGISSSAATQECGPSSAETVSSTEDRSVNVQALTEVPGIPTSPTRIHIGDAARVQIGPRMSVTAHKPNHHVIGQAIVDPDSHASVGEVVSLY